MYYFFLKLVFPTDSRCLADYLSPCNVSGFYFVFARAYLHALVLYNPRSALSLLRYFCLAVQSFLILTFLLCCIRASPSCLCLNFLALLPGLPSYCRSRTVVYLLNLYFHVVAVWHQVVHNPAKPRLFTGVWETNLTNLQSLCCLLGNDIDIEYALSILTVQSN